LKTSSERSLAVWGAQAASL